MVLKVKKEPGLPVGLSVGIFGDLALSYYTLMCFDEDLFDVVNSVAFFKETFVE
jgi:hypothetical protein